jgi:hypothetical protein
MSLSIRVRSDHGAVVVALSGIDDAARLGPLRAPLTAALLDSELLALEVHPDFAGGAAGLRDVLIGVLEAAPGGRVCVVASDPRSVAPSNSPASTTWSRSTGPSPKRCRSSSTRRWWGEPAMADPNTPGQTAVGPVSPAAPWGPRPDGSCRSRAGLRPGVPTLLPRPEWNHGSP